MSKLTKAPTLPTLVWLTPKQVRSIPKPARDFPDWIGPMLEFYEDNEDALRIEGLDVASVRASMAAVQALQGPRREAMKRLNAIDHTILFHKGLAWKAFLEMYARASTVGRMNRRVARGVAPFVKLMKKKKKRKARAPSR